MSKHKQRKIGQLYYYLILHRWMGLSAAFLIIILALTGILLNHTDSLKLNQKYLNNPQILSWYGIKMPTQQLYFKQQHNWVAQVGKHLYFNQEMIDKEIGRLQGVIRNNEVVLIALENALLLITDEGELIEKITPAMGLPTPIEKIAIGNQEQVILVVGNAYYSSDDEFLSWHSVKKSAQDIYPFSFAQLPPKEIMQQYRDIYLGNNLPVERFILDLHSGRIFGQLGVYVMDVAAITMIFLSLSGTWVWLQRHIRRKPLN